MSGMSRADDLWPVRLTALARLCGSDALAVVLPERDAFGTYVTHNFTGATWSSGAAIPFFARVMRERVTERISAAIALADGRTADTLAVAPIPWKDQVIGVLVAASAGRAVTTDELSALTTCGELVALDLAGTNMLWRAQRQAYDADTRLRAALELQRALTSGANDALFERATATLAETFGADAVSIMLLDGRKELSVRSARGLSDDAMRRRRRIGEGISGRVAQTGQPLLLTGRVEGGNDPTITESMVVPLRTADRNLGVVSVRHSTKPARYGQAQLDTLVALAADVAVAAVLADELQSAQEDRKHALVLYELSRFVTLGTDAQADLDSAAAMIAGTMRHSAVGIWELRGMKLRLRASTGYGAVLPSEVTLTETDTTLAIVLQEKRTARVSFAPADARPDWAAPGSATFLLAPIGAYGVLVLGRASGAYSDAEAAFGALLSEYLIGMLQKHSSEGDIDRAIATERRRIAQEIHDGLAQELTGVVLALEGCQRALEKDAALLRPQLAKTARDARATLADVRQYMTALRQSETGALNLPVTLSRLVDDLRRQSGLKVDMEESGSERALAPIVERAVIRIVGESLRNVAQHSGAGQAKVTLVYGPEEVTVTVEDDGKGFDVDQVIDSAEQTGHFGVVGMRERAEAAGGHLVIRSEPERGTIVRATLPYASEGSPAAQRGVPQRAATEEEDTGDRAGFFNRLLRR